MKFFIDIIKPYGPYQMILQKLIRFRKIILQT